MAEIALRKLIGEEDYEKLQKIRHRALEESKLSPMQLYCPLGVYEVNRLIRIIDKAASALE